MVNLPATDLGEEERRRREEIPTPWPRDRHRQWGTSNVRYVHGEPQGLQDLEMLARRAVALMEKHGQKSETNYIKVMDLLRCQYNMNYLMLCNNCDLNTGEAHSHDELLAPER